MYAAIATFALSATAAYSQSLPLPTSGGEAEQAATQGLQQLSGECRNAILSLATSPLAQCLNVAALAPAISANSSVVPILDDWMTQICSSEPCDQDELNSAASNFSTACGSDFEQYNVDAEDIEGIAGLYPLVRELVCLKTTEPFSNSTTADNSTETSNSTETTNSTSNSTEFCVTSLLTELSSYLDTDLTVNNIFGLVLGSDQEGREALMSIAPEALCQDCVYSAAGLIEQQYPGIWDQPLVNGNFTVGGFLNETCSNETFAVIDETNNTVTLPESVFPAAENSTYPYGITYFNGTYEPSEDVEQPPALPFANIEAAPIANGTETETTSSAAPSSTASAAATSATAAASSSAAGVTESAAGVTSSAAASAAEVTGSAAEAVSSAVQARDVTAAKRRWIGQQ